MDAFLDDERVELNMKLRQFGIKQERLFAKFLTQGISLEEYEASMQKLRDEKCALAQSLGFDMGGSDK